jgi:hypothetical protein
MFATAGRTQPESHAMDFDDQLRRYFATDDLAAVSPDALAAGVERMRVDFGMESDRGRRFALWTLMHMFGVAPELDVAFKDESDRNAARDFMEMLERAAGD